MMPFMIRLESEKWTYSIDHNFARIRIDSHNSLLIDLLSKTLTFHNVIILIKSVFNKNQNHYYYNLFLEKGSYERKSYTHFFLNECLCIINVIFR